MNLRWELAQFFEIRWWQHYLRGKDKTVYLEWKRKYWKAFLVKTGINPSTGEKVLDAGCGPAGIFTVLEMQQVDALDPLFDQYRLKIPQFNLADFPWTLFYCQQIEHYFPEYQYDTVFCLNAVNHVSNLPLCLDRLVGLTKPGGLIVLSVDAHNIPLLRRLFRLIPGDVLHPHQHDLGEYEAMLTARGVCIERRVLIKNACIFGYWVLVGRTSVRP